MPPLCSTLFSQEFKRIVLFRLGHAVYEPGTLGQAEIVGAFGPQVLDDSGGAVNRARLRAAVFGSGAEDSAETAARTKAARSKLESIVWPRVRELIVAQINEALEPGGSVPGKGVNLVVVVEAAMLIEAGWADLCDEVTPIEGTLHFLTFCNLKRAGFNGFVSGLGRVGIPRRGFGSPPRSRPAYPVRF